MFYGGGVESTLYKDRERSPEIVSCEKKHGTELHATFLCKRRKRTFITFVSNALKISGKMHESNNSS
jgi:hypothetical protein